MEEGELPPSPEMFQDDDCSFLFAKENENRLSPEREEKTVEDNLTPQPNESTSYERDPPVNSGHGFQDQNEQQNAQSNNVSDTRSVDKRIQKTPSGQDKSRLRPKLMRPTYTLTDDEIILNLTVIVKPRDMPLPPQYANATVLELQPATSQEEEEELALHDSSGDSPAQSAANSLENERTLEGTATQQDRSVADFHEELPDHVSASYLLEMLNNQEWEERLNKKRRQAYPGDQNASNYSQSTTGMVGSSHLVNRSSLRPSRGYRPYFHTTHNYQSNRVFRQQSETRIQMSRDSETSNNEAAKTTSVCDVDPIFWTRDERGKIQGVKKKYRNPNVADLRTAAPNFCSTLAEVRSMYGTMDTDDKVRCQIQGCRAELLFRGSSMLQHVYKHAPGRIFRCPYNDEEACQFRGAAFSFMVIAHIRKRHPHADPYNFTDMRSYYDKELAEVTLKCYGVSN